jgi:hypothetical protein
MSGVYGDILTAFSEQLIEVDYFDMQPKHDGGFADRTDKRKVSGVLQCVEGRRVKNQNGNLVTTRGMAFWSEEVLQAGRFIDDGVLVYRIAGDDEWIREAGFTRYPISRVTGADGTEMVEPEFSKGTGAFA